MCPKRPQLWAITRELVWCVQLSMWSCLTWRRISSLNFTMLLISTMGWDKLCACRNCATGHPYLTKFISHWPISLYVEPMTVGWERNWSVWRELSNAGDRTALAFIKTAAVKHVFLTLCFHGPAILKLFFGLELRAISCYPPWSERHKALSDPQGRIVVWRISCLFTNGSYKIMNYFSPFPSLPSLLTPSLFWLFLHLLITYDINIISPNSQQCRVR